MVAILFGLLPTNGRILGCFLGFDDCQWLAILSHEHVVTILMPLIRSGWFFNPIGQTNFNVVFLDNLDPVVDIPAGSSQLFVNDLFAGGGFVLHLSGRNDRK